VCVQYGRSSKTCKVAGSCTHSFKGRHKEGYDMYSVLIEKLMDSWSAHIEPSYEPS
jgi:hypothetical protein